MFKKQLVSFAAVAVLATGVAFAAVQQDKVMYKQADGTYVVNTTNLCSNVKGFREQHHWRFMSRIIRWLRLRLCLIVRLQSSMAR